MSVKTSRYGETNRQCMSLKLKWTMPWVYNDGGFSESGLTNRGRRKHGSPVVAAIAIAEQRRYSEVYYELRTLQWDFTMRARSKRKQEHSGDPHHGVFVEVFRPYLIERGWLWTPTMAVGSGVTDAPRLRGDPGPAAVPRAGVEDWSRWSTGWRTAPTIRAATAGARCTATSGPAVEGRPSSHNRQARARIGVSQFRHRKVRETTVTARPAGDPRTDRRGAKSRSPRMARPRVTR